MSCGAPCEWVKEHIDNRHGFVSELLITNDGEYLQCINDGTTYYLKAMIRGEDDVSHPPCEWIRKYWNAYDVVPPDYPCEWIRLHWND